MNLITGNLPILQAAGGAFSPTAMIPFVVIIGIFYFLIIRPQRKKQKETKSMLDALKKGDKVQSIGGIRGVVQNVGDTTVVLKVDDNTKLEFTKTAISDVIEVSSVTQKVEKKETEKTEKTEETKK